MVTAERIEALEPLHQRIRWRELWHKIDADDFRFLVEWVFGTDHRTDPRKLRGYWEPRHLPDDWGGGHDMAMYLDLPDDIRAQYGREDRGFEFHEGVEGEVVEELRRRGADLVHDDTRLWMLDR